jgi:PTS system nitrogen regulatory IIA component
MDLGALIPPERVLLGVRAADKAAVLAALAARASAALGLAPAPVLEALAARERLGSTGLGRGFALPHARLPGIGGFFGLFMRLARPVAFEAVDGEPVDLLVLLLIPAAAAGEDHVAALAAVARRMREASVPARLRAAPDAASVVALLAGG